MTSEYAASSSSGAYKGGKDRYSPASSIKKDDGLLFEAARILRKANGRDSDLMARRRPPPCPPKGIIQASIPNPNLDSKSGLCVLRKQAQPDRTLCIPKRRRRRTEHVEIGETSSASSVATLSPNRSTSSTVDDESHSNKRQRTTISTSYQTGSRTQTSPQIERARKIFRGLVESGTYVERNSTVSVDTIQHDNQHDNEELKFKWNCSSFEEEEETFYNMLNLAVFHFLSPEDVLLVRQVNWKWRTRLNNTPLLLCSVWESLPYDIYWSMRKNELRNPITSGSVGSLSPELDPGMLHTLFRWVLDLAMDYSMSLQTVFCCCTIIYRVLSKLPVVRKHLQLLGMIGFLLAAKMHERQHPLVHECVELCANLYSKEDIRKTETSIAKTLQWSLHSPNVYTVVMHMMKDKRFGIHEDTQFLCVFLCELTLTDWELAELAPSKLALAIVCLAQYTYSLPYDTAVIMSGYNRPHIEDAARRMLACWKRCSPNGREATVFTKVLRARYLSEEMGAISEIEPPEDFLTHFLNA